MGLFDIFKKKKEVPVEVSPNPEVAFIEPQESKRNVTDLCELCQEPIGEERFKKLAGRYVHKRCFKDQRNKMKAEGKAF